MLKKEIEEDTNKWKHIQYSWVGKLTLLKCPYYPKQSRVNTIPIKVPTTYLMNVRQIFQKFIRNHKRPPNNLSDIEEEEQNWKYHAT